MNIFKTLLSLFAWAVILRIILDWIRVPVEHPVGRLRSMLGTVVDPVLAPIRKVIPPIRAGEIGIDLSPLVLLLGLQLLIAYL